MPPAALITGAGGGIGRGLAVGLAARGVSVTIADVDLAAARRVATEAEALGVRALAIGGDVSVSTEHEAMFEAHMSRFGRLDVCVLNAGITEKGQLLDDPRSPEWSRTLDVDLTAVLEGIKLATQAMRRSIPPSSREPLPGFAHVHKVIMCVSSAAGMFPVPFAPVYAASKAGVVAVTRSLGPVLVKENVRICCLCPEYVDTALTRGAGGLVEKLLAETRGRMLSVEEIATAGMHLVCGGDRQVRPGACMLVRGDGEWSFALAWALRSVDRERLASNVAMLQQEARPAQSRKAASLPKQSDSALAIWARESLSKPTFRRIVVHLLSTKFDRATRLVAQPVPALPLPPGQVLLRVAYAGVNASDINYSAGRYHSSLQAAQAALPYPSGFEAVSVVVAAAADVPSLAPGDAVASMEYGSFSELLLLPHRALFKVPRPCPEVLALLTSGLTASLGLAQCGILRKGQSVFVTAAAGGAGQFAVQLAAAAGCRVVALVGSPAKAAVARRLGAAACVDYRAEDLKAALAREFPKGIDLVWETVGGETFDLCLKAMAPGGTLLVVGAMSQYQGDWKAAPHAGLTDRLLTKSGTVKGFFLPHHRHEFGVHFRKLVHAWQRGDLKVLVDDRVEVGLEQCSRAVDRLHSGRSVGKVVLQVAPSPPPLPASL